MPIRVTAQNLKDLISLAQDANAQTLANLQHADDQLPGNHDDLKLSANYRALSQILDDMVRIANVTDQIDTSLTQVVEPTP